MSETVENTATLPHQAADVTVGTRAGFWRRAFAFMIDSLIVTIAIQLLVAGLFFATSGRVQILGDLNYTTCSELKAVPAGLVPPPPAGVNFAQQCNITFFGLPTAKILQVGQVIAGTTEKDGSAAKAHTAKTPPKGTLKTYMLDRDSRPVDGTMLEWFAMLALVTYLIAMETRTGATLGSRAMGIRVMGIRVIDATAPDSSGVPLREVLARYAAMLIGALPIVFVTLIYFGFYAAPGELATWLTELGRHDPLFGDLKSNALQWDPLLPSYLNDLPGLLPRVGDLGSLEYLYDIASLALNIWIIYLIVQIVRRRDPVYDKIAGTSVVQI